MLEAKQEVTKAVSLVKDRRSSAKHILSLKSSEMGAHVLRYIFSHCRSYNVTVPLKSTIKVKQKKKKQKKKKKTKKKKRLPLETKNTQNYKNQRLGLIESLHMLNGSLWGCPLAPARLTKIELMTNLWKKGFNKRALHSDKCFLRVSSL